MSLPEIQQCSDAWEGVVGVVVVVVVVGCCSMFVGSFLRRGTKGSQSMHEQ